MVTFSEAIAFFDRSILLDLGGAVGVKDLGPETVAGATVEDFYGKVGILGKDLFLDLHIAGSKNGTI